MKEEGNILILFPEGTRTTTGTMGRFRSGIGRLAAGNDIDILPCHLEGGLRAWPKGRLLPRPRKLHLRIGQAKNYRHLDPGPASVRAVCAELEAYVDQLGGGAE